MGDIAQGAQQAGEQVDRSVWLDHAVRAGMVAYGVVHLMLAFLAVQLALGDRSGSTSTTGAIQQLAEQPFGRTMVWLVALGLVLLVVWRVLEGTLGRQDEDGADQALKRAVSLGKAVIYGVLAFSAIKVAAGSGSGSGSGGSGSDPMTARLMGAPGGQVLVGLVGLAVVAYGGVQIWIGWSERFLQHLDSEGRGGTDGSAYRWLGRIGYAAKGIAVGIVGALFGYAAITHEASKSGGLDQALQKVLQQPFGPVLLTLIGLGIGSYGLFAFARARHLNR